MFLALPSLGVVDVLDIAVVSVVAYLVITWIRRLHSQRILLGFAAFAVAYFLARQFGLRLTERIFQGFFAVLVIAAVVILQPELRRLFERLVAWGMGRSPHSLSPGDLVDVLVNTATRLAERRFGAIVVIPGKDSLDRHVDGGVILNEQISEPLLLSLFDPSTDGHDGAVILHGNSVELFSAHLPLSRDFAKLQSRGTRHAAALGLVERTDALCVVVSEERGRVSVARGGHLRELAQVSELESELRAFLREVSPAEKAPPKRLAFLRRNLLEKTVAVVVATVAWLFLISTTSLQERRLHVPILVQNIPEGYSLEGFEPTEVEAVILGSDSDLDLADEGALRLRVDATSVSTGERVFTMSERDMHLPANLSVVEFTPHQLRVTVKGPEAKESRPQEAPDAALDHDLPLRIPEHP